MRQQEDHPRDDGGRGGCGDVDLHPKPRSHLGTPYEGLKAAWKLERGRSSEHRRLGYRWAEQQQVQWQQQQEGI